jgi:hypothetical protein
MVLLKSTKCGLMNDLPYLYNSPENNLLIDSKYYIIAEKEEYKTPLYKTYLP